MSNQVQKFEHRAINLTRSKEVVYTAMSKKIVFFKDHITKFALENQKVPLHGFGLFKYFLLDTVDRDRIRNANNNLIKLSDELWVFGPISDGVLAEIKLAKEIDMPVKYFKIEDSKRIEEASKDELEFEEELESFKEEL